MELPEELLNSLTLVKGFDREAFIKVHENTNRITSIRLNSHKKANLSFPLGEKIPWAQNGYNLIDRPYFTHDPFFHAGCYYVQEPGSMFIEQYLKREFENLNEPKVLDLCAAPGGKSTLVSNLLGNKGLLVANEYVKNRSGILARNLAKWGTNNTIVTNNSPNVFNSLPNYFDVVIADVPCSGSGLFRKQPTAIEEWSLENVKACSIRQKEIMEVAVNTLKFGGLLLYSTCSFSEEENEAIAEWLVRDLGLELVKPDIESSWGLVESGGGLRFFPYLTQSEGFFVAGFRKPEEANPNYRIKKSLPPVKGFNEWVDLNQGTVIELAGKLHYSNSLVIRFLEESHPSLFYRKAGILMGELKGKDFIPDQELAYAPFMRDKVQNIDLNLEQALLFLKKANFTIEAGAPLGLTLACYEGHGLGWFKKLPNRINNYLPQDLMVLH